MLAAMLKEAIDGASQNRPAILRELMTWMTQRQDVHTRWQDACASRTAYLITNGSYLNGHSHSHFKSNT